MRERRFLVEEAARVQAMRQLLAIEAASSPYMDTEHQRDMFNRYNAILRGESVTPLTQEAIWAANRASFYGALEHRKLKGTPDV